AGAPLHDEPEAERLDEPAPRLAGLRRELKVDLRQVEHHAIRIGERERCRLDRTAEVENKARAVRVAAESRVGRDRDFGGRPSRHGLRRPGGHDADQEHAARHGEPPPYGAKPHGFLTYPPAYPIDP